MKNPDFNDPAVSRRLLNRIRKKAEQFEKLHIMEVCGTHTMAIGRFGLRKMLPENIRLVSGPGCPVCVTPAEYIDNALELARSKSLTIATFGDMLRVPGNTGSLERARAEGADIRIVTSPAEVLEYDTETVFLAVGFETTLAAIAAATQSAVTGQRSNLSFYYSLKAVPPTLSVLASDPELNLDGFLLPGHVSVIIGSDAYRFMELPGAIVGFDMVDILSGVDHLAGQHLNGEAHVHNLYTRVVQPKGNELANNLIQKLFKPSDQAFRGFGPLPGCSLALKEEWRHVDAETKYGLPPLTEKDSGACRCGDILKGKILPPECPLFSKACEPENPKGPCMVSSEGSCAAYFKYEREIIAS